MPPERLALRHACNAFNAYRPCSALYLTFSSLWHSDSFIEFNSHSNGSSRGYRDCKSPPKQSKVQFSTRSPLKQESSPASTSVQAVLDEDRARLQGGAGTYKNHDLLKEHLEHHERVEGTKQTGTDTLEKSKPSQTKGAQKSSRQKRRSQEIGDDGTSNRFRKVDPRTRLEGEDIARPLEPYAFQIHMIQVAKDAGSLAKIKVRLSDTDVINKRKRRLDYRGRYIDYPKSPLDQPMPVPWATELAESYGKDASELLELEIRRFVQHMECTHTEKVARAAVLSELTEMIAEHAGAEVTSELFGSERTGLALSTSDIDIRLDCDVHNEYEKGQVLIAKLKDITTAMQNSGKYILVVGRWGTKYPIVNAQHKRTGIHVQIVAAPSSAPQDAVTLQYLNEHPHLRPLYILFRAALGARGLVDVYNGGIGSYGLFIMITAAIRRRSSSPPTSLTEELFRFIDFYHSIDKSKYGISVSPPKLFKKHDPWEVPVKAFIEAARRRGDLIRSAQWAISQRRLYQPYLLCLQDPANPLNDLGRKSNAIKHIQTTLDGIYGNLISDMKSAAMAAAEGKGRPEGSILMRLVGPCHEVNFERRRKVHEYGVEVIASQNAATQSVKASETDRREVLEAVA